MELNSHYFDAGNIKVLRVITPQLYWITCSNCISPNEINQHMRVACSKTNSDLAYLTSVPNLDERVIVKEADRILFRGIVKSVAGSKCTVWLTDVCRETQIDYSEMLINQLLLWRDLDSQAHLIGVSGLPDCSKTDPELTKILIQQINKEVEYVLQQFRDFQFSFENLTNNNDIPYGSITLTKKDSRRDWSKTLIENGAFRQLDSNFNQVGVSRPIELTYIKQAGDPANIPTSIVKRNGNRNPIYASTEPQESVIALSKGLITDSKHIVKTSSKVSLMSLNHFYNSLPKSSLPIKSQDDTPDEDAPKEDAPIAILSPHSSIFNYPISKIEVDKNHFSNRDLSNSVTVFEKRVEKSQTGVPVGRCRPRLNNYGDPLTHTTDHGLGRGKYIKHLLTCQLNQNYQHERKDFLNSSIQQKIPHAVITEEKSVDTNKTSTLVSELKVLETKIPHAVITEEESVDTNKTSTLVSDLKVLETKINDPTPTLCTQILEYNEQNNATNSDERLPLTIATASNDVQNYVLPEVTNYVSDAFLFSDDEEETEKLQTHAIRGVDYVIGESLEMMKNSCALLHGYPQPKLVSSFNALALNQLITSNLRTMDIVDMAKCQIYSIPVLLAKKNLVLIGPGGTKKTTSYLLPLLTHLLDETSYSQLNPGCGPRGVIIVPDAQRVQHVADLCSSFCDYHLKVVSTHGGGLELEKKDALANGCDLLISTPRCWLRLLSYKHITNIMRLCHIVFDSYDDLSSLFRDELIEIYLRIGNLEKYRQDNNLSYQVQKVFVGKTWNKLLEHIVFQYLPNPVLCITAHLEAAIYAQVKLYLTVLKKEFKHDKLLEIIKENKIVRTVVVCNTPVEVKLLKEFLSCYSSNIIIAHEDMHHSFIQETRLSWQSNSDFLICSDQVLLELGITNAQWLINYSIPLSKAAFSDRFSLLQDNFNDRISNPKVEASKCQAHLLVEDGNELQYPKLLALVERSNAKIPDSLKELNQRILDTREQLKSSQPFCNNMLQFGQCRKMELCPKQHIINLERDKPTVPDHGYLIISLVEICDASHYSARILFTADKIKKDISESGWVPFPSELARISSILLNYYSNSQNWHLIRKVKIGQLVAIYDEANKAFLRAQIMKTYATKGISPLKDDVLVWIIDDGGTIRVKPENLYKLPKAAKEIPPQTVHLYIANIQPFDFDLSWSLAASNLVEQRIINAYANDTNLFCIGKTLMVIGSSVIIEDFCIYEKLPALNCCITKLSIRNIMLTLGLGLKSDNHVKNLKKLSIDAHMIQPEEEEEESFSDANYGSTDKKWAHLPKDEFSRVFVSNGQNPDLFYVSQIKFQPMLDLINADLKVAIEKKEVENLRFISVGALCSVQNDKQEWNRASIINVTDNLEVEVLLVDVGLIIKKKISDIYELPEDLITRLPFQAVECELEGVSPAKGQWCDRGTSWFLTSLKDDGYPKTFELKVCDIKLNAEFTGGHHYSVVLINYINPTTKLCLNKDIVIRGYAYWNEEKKNKRNIETILQELPNEQPLDEFLQDNELTDDQPLDVYLQDKELSDQDLLHGHTRGLTSENSELENINGSELCMKYDDDDDDDTIILEDGFEIVGINKMLCDKYLKSLAKANNHLLDLDWHSSDKQNNELPLNRAITYQNDNYDSVFKQDNIDNVPDSEKDNFSIMEEGGKDKIVVLEEDEKDKVYILEECENDQVSIVDGESDKVSISEGENDKVSIIEDSENDKVSVLEESENDKVSISECESDKVSIIEDIKNDKVSTSEGDSCKVSVREEGDDSEEDKVSILEQGENDKVSVLEESENDEVPVLEEDGKDKVSILEQVENDTVSVLEESEDDEVPVLEEDGKDKVSILEQVENDKVSFLEESEKDNVSTLEESGAIEIVRPILKWPIMNWNVNRNTSAQTNEAQDKNTREIRNIKVEQKSPCQSDSDEGEDFYEEVPDLEPGLNVDDDVPHLVAAVPFSTPNVYWRQDSIYVWLKVLVPDISGYKIYSKVDYIIVQAHVQEKMYWLHVDLFGPLEKKTLVPNLTGQYLEMKVEKLVKNFMWPRLTYLDTPAPNIKHDPDHDYLFYDVDLTDESQETDQFQDCESDGSSQNASDVEELKATPFDPFDPDF